MMSRLVSIYLESVTFGRMTLSTFLFLDQLESESDEVEQRLIDHLRNQVAKGVIKVLARSAAWRSSTINFDSCSSVDASRFEK